MTLSLLTLFFFKQPQCENSKRATQMRISWGTFQVRVIWENVELTWSVFGKGWVDKSWSNSYNPCIHASPYKFSKKSVTNFPRLIVDLESSNFNLFKTTTMRKLEKSDGFLNHTQMRISWCTFQVKIIWENVEWYEVF